MSFRQRRPRNESETPYHFEKRRGAARAWKWMAGNIGKATACKVFKGKRRECMRIKGGLTTLNADNQLCQGNEDQKVAMDLVWGSWN